VRNAHVTAPGDKSVIIALINERFGGHHDYTEGVGLDCFNEQTRRAIRTALSVYSWDVLEDATLCPCRPSGNAKARSARLRSKHAVLPGA
jgi:hypothetical protein